MTGAVPLPGTGWTIAGMVSQTSGIPLLIPVEGNSYGEYSDFLPGVYSIGEILEREGYNQELMVGSDSVFGGRDLYFKQHGNYEIYDLFTAREKKKIPEDYEVYWGFEDEKLYQYAKEEISLLAEKGEPFNFTMLTVDTHHVGGYLCPLCKNEYPQQYENVIACADRQVSSFLSWISSQDFYENTTIIISGDHLSMDNEFWGAFEQQEKRGIYNCFINSAVNPQNEKNRTFSALDMFPTTLAAMGVKIEGERLGLGTNLFSGKETLLEEYGIGVVETELEKQSNFYNDKFLY